MNAIKLQSDGGLIHGNRRLKGDPLPFLGFQVVLDKGCRLRSFFRMLEAYPILKQLNPFIPSFSNSFTGCSSDGCRMDGVTELVLLRRVEMTGYPGDPGMNLLTSFEGLGGGGSLDIKAFWLEQLLDIPLVLGGLKHRVFGDKIDDFDFDTVFNLFELIDGICWQLSFHNLPDACRLDL